MAGPGRESDLARREVGDREAHHLIDPRTGNPASGPVVSATAVAATATYSQDPDRRNAIITYATFLNAKERAGIERAQLSAVF